MRNFSLLMMFFIIACNDIKSRQKTDFSLINNQLQEIPSFISDKFILDALENEFNLKNIEEICQDFKRQFKFVKNNYSAIIDTVFVYAKNRDTIEIYNTFHKRIILRMNLNSNKIGLLKNALKVGLTKEYFIEVYPSIKDNDVFKICNTEGLICFQFTLLNGKVSNIRFQSSYID